MIEWNWIVQAFQRYGANALFFAFIVVVSVVVKVVVKKVGGGENLTAPALVVRGLLEAAVYEKLDEAAQTIANAVSKEYSKEDEERVQELLSSYVSVLSEEEREKLACLIVETLKATAL